MCGAARCGAARTDCRCTEREVVSRGHAGKLWHESHGGDSRRNRGKTGGEARRGLCTRMSRSDFHRMRRDVALGLLAISWQPALPNANPECPATLRDLAQPCGQPETGESWMGHPGDLSRRRSRVRVPSLPSLEVPAKRHRVLPQQADVARLGQQTGSTFVLSQVQKCLQISPSQRPLGCASEQLRDSVRSGNMTSGVFMASAEHRALSADTPAIFPRARADSSTGRRGCRRRGRVAPSP
jgi:hypothetical protein